MSAAGLWGLLDWALGDSLSGFIACVAFGLGVIVVFKLYKLPMVDGIDVGF